MIKFTSYSSLIDISRMQDFTTSDGLPGIEIQFNDSPEVINIKTTLAELESKINQIYQQLQEEKLLRENNPSVKDAWEQYQTTINLVKNHKVDNE